MSSTNRGGRRSPADSYPTPAWCVRRALEAIQLPGGEWLEPCAGAGSIVRAARAVRRDVRWSAYEIQRRHLRSLTGEVGSSRALVGDFLAAEELPRYDVIFTNPPYSKAQPFLEKALGIADHVVLLLRLNFLASEARSSLMQSFAPDVYVLPNRPSFNGLGTDSIEYAWFHWHARPRRTGRLEVLPSTSAQERARDRGTPR